MKKATTAISVLLLSAFSAFAQGGEQKDIPTMAAEAADYLNKILDLEDWQLYQVDSTFLHNYEGMTGEVEVLRKKGANNSDLYVQISDKWMDKCDSTFLKIFSEDQWKRYLKLTTYGKAKRERDKRNAKKAAKN